LILIKVRVCIWKAHIFAASKERQVRNNGYRL
jgi:hypothetical protein